MTNFAVFNIILKFEFTLSYGIIIFLVNFYELKSEIGTNSSSQNSTDMNNIQFVLFTRRSSPTNLIIGDKDTFLNSGFNTSNPTKIIIHGYLSSIKEEVFVMNKDAYLKTGDHNVIGVDWSRLNDVVYVVARVNALRVGKLLGIFLNFLITICDVNPKKIHIIGHSLGAHIAGIGAKQLTENSVGRITGLDPASPGFFSNKQDQFLSREDADLVDVIHTFTRAFSISKPVGHLDFYPNGGKFQRGCPNLYNLWQMERSMLCNHGRAYMYFAESIINKKAFKCFRCSDIEAATSENCTEVTGVHMGQDDTYDRNGLYYVKTNPNPPFSIDDV